MVPYAPLTTLRLRLYPLIGYLGQSPKTCQGAGAGFGTRAPPLFRFAFSGRERNKEKSPIPDRWSAIEPPLLPPSAEGCKVLFQALI